MEVRDLSMRALLTLFIAIASGAAQLPAQKAELPSVVRAGLLGYEHAGPAAALRIWSQDSPIAGQFGNEAQQAFEHIESVYGKMIGYEPLQVVPLGTHASRSYIVILYESGPVYMRFDCYLKSDHWVMTAFLFNVKPDTILPPTMLVH